jgi:CRP-like cAMP-binding protein
MPIATAALDFTPFGRTGKIPSLATTPELAALSECQLFAGADPSILHSLGQACSIKQVSRGSTIVAEGSLVGQAFLVVRGRVRAVRRGESGREITLEVFRPGDLLADAFLAPDQPLTNDWEAVEPTVLLVFPREALLAHLRHLPELSLALGRILVGRLNRSKDLAVGLALSDVQARVIAALRFLASQEGEGQEVPEGIFLRRRPTQQELANLIGACRETVSRIVSDLTRRGFLTPQGRSLLISKRAQGQALGG